VYAGPIAGAHQNTYSVDMALITNRRARFDFEILDTFEAGLSLLGTEVKSLRKGQGKLDGAYVVIRGGEALLVGCSIPPFQQKNVFGNYDPERPRTLLVTQKELKELEQKSEKQGLTIVPLSLYNKGRYLKLEIAIARGKKKADKRESIKKRETNRDIGRILKNDSRV
jgi:SsrA-binding protein